MKGFNLATVGGSAGSQPGLAASTPSLTGCNTVSALGNACSRTSMQTLNETTGSVLCGTNNTGTVGPASLNKGNPLLRSPITKLAQLARLAGAKKADSKKKWGNLIEAARSAKGVGRMWTRSRSRSEDSVSSDGSGGAALQVNDDGISNMNRREKYTKPRSGYPVVHLTENELPEVLEESGFDYELSGRMGMDSVSNLNSPISSLRRFRRACSEPVDQVTLIVEEEYSSKDQTKTETYPCSRINLASSPNQMPDPSGTCHLRFRTRGGDLSSMDVVTNPPSTTAKIQSRDWMAGQNLPDNQILPFVDDSVDPSTMSSSSMEAVFKSLNGVGDRETTVSGDTVYDTGIQPLGQNSSGGWL